MPNWESAVGSVIQATRTMEFEDGLRTRVLPRDPCGIQFKTSWVCGLVLLGGGVVMPVIPNFNSVKFRASVVLNYSCCGVRIELAVESLQLLLETLK